jgi:hypothetical protein
VTELEIAWLAGLLEGEGSFMSPAPSEPRQPRISIVMTDEDVIQRVAGLVGVKYINIRQENIKWKPSYRVQLKGARAVQLMQAVRPHMGARRGAKIDAILATYAPPTGRRLTEAEARHILARKGLARARDVAAEHDLHIKTVEQIWRGRLWASLHLTGQ